MRTADVMTQEVISILPTASVGEAARVMLDNKISGLPVIDVSNALVGIVTEGDFLRRRELGTDKRRSRWIELLIGPAAVANEYVEAHARRVSDVMTQRVVTVEEDTPLDQVVHVMETKHVKRLPVMRGSHVVGMISRANLLRAVAALQPAASQDTTDANILARLRLELAEHFPDWERYNIAVKDGVVELNGTVLADRERDAIRIAAENTRGVKKVHDHLVWIEPSTGFFFESPEDAEAKSDAPDKIAHAS